jgi:flagellar basal-body rod modification protein FlgD
VTVTVEDANGQVIRQVKLDGTQKGNVAFTWDGKDNSGNAVKEGNYQLKVSGTVNGKNETFNGLVYNRVESVTLGTSSNPTTVKLKGIGAVYLTDILEIAGSKSNTSSGTGSST